MRIYNTWSRRKEEFIPIKDGEVGFYVCGPTVYNHIHIGNARTFISFDVIRRYLEFRGFAVRFVQNITDVDDKIINRAQELGSTPEAVAAEYTEAFRAAMRAIGVREPTVQPKATEELAAMIDLIIRLVDAGHAYQVDGDVYFAVRSFAAYGRLSGRDIDQLLSGARVEIDERKRDALDFALWKAAKPGEPAWESPWGLGRPGWHIECSAMSRRYLGESFDIHGGGEDLIFPHHENEIAQSLASGPGQFARYWLHGGMLTINDAKMSKSEGNYLLLKDVLGHVRPAALRLLMLQSHYRSPFDYSPQRLEEAGAALLRVENALRNLEWAAEAGGVGGWSEAEERAELAEVTGSENPTVQLLALVEKAESRLIEQMDDDFNTAAAVAALFELISAANVNIASVAGGLLDRAHAVAARITARRIRGLFAVLGIELAEAGEAGAEAPANELPAALAAEVEALLGASGLNTEQATEALLALRAEARANKDWQLADKIRDIFNGLGLVIEDTAQGTRVYPQE